ncbi:hypothetical protein NQZ68_022377 [Dissostichus eleginoides]|nr:hypothetical protein NQZ68_022377 [Dissostichus eleginoides]
MLDDLYLIHPSGDDCIPPMISDNSTLSSSSCWRTPMGPLALCLSTNRREGEEEPEQQQQRARFTRRGDVKLRHDREDAVDLKP